MPPPSTPRLTTGLRRLGEQDIQIAQEAPPPPTSTVPAFRKRRCRGDSTFLKDVYPSGFCPSKPEHRLLPTTHGHPAVRCNTTAKGLLSGKVGLGIPKWGKPGDKRIVTVTQVLMGSETVSDTAGNDLVQFGPAFHCGPTECAATPTRLNGLLLTPRPMTPLTPIRTTIDGSSLKGRSLLVSSHASQWDREVTEWPQRKLPRSPGGGRNRHDRAGRKRGRPLTADRLSRGGRPEPWTFTADASSHDRHGDAVGGSRGLGIGLEASAFRQRDGLFISTARMTGDQAAPKAETNDANDVPADDHALAPDPRQHFESITATPASAGSCVGLGKEILEQIGDVVQQGSQDVSAASRLTRQVDSGQIPQVTVVGDGDGESIAGEFAHGRQRSSRESSLQDDAVKGSSIGVFSQDEDGDDGSVYPLDSMATVGPSCESLASEESLERVSAKRSVSSIDTERYGGNLSKNANDIVRSHIQPAKAVCTGNSRTDPGADELEENELEHDIVVPAGGITNMLSPLHPPSPPLKAGTTFLEGMNAIAASEVLAGSGGGIPADVNGNSQVATGEQSRHVTDPPPPELAFFNARTGTWEAIRKKSDWKIMLAAPAGQHGAGVTFSYVPGGTKGRDADFLVTVAHAPETRDDHVAEIEAPMAFRKRNNKNNETLAGLLNRSIRSRHSLLPCTVTPGVLSIPQEGQQDNFQDQNGRHLPQPSTMPGKHDLLHPHESRVHGPSLTLPSEGDRVRYREAERDDERSDTAEPGRQLAGLVGGRRRQRPGPGGGLWLSGSAEKHGNRAATTPLPKKAKTRHMAKYLEARLVLKGQCGTPGLPSGPSQKIDMPYSKELAKWGYDEILGIPKAVVAG